MLVSLYRVGPLRHVIAKGYVVRSPDAPNVIADLVRRPPELPAGMRLRADPDNATVWVDTGPVWLIDAAHRTALTGALSEATASVAVAVSRRRGELVPNGWLPAAGGAGWLCPDLHAVEVASDTERELCTNLLRRWVPEIVALTGRAAFSPAHMEPTGSRRLAQAADHMPTRYLDSASGVHMKRVQASLRRDHGIGRLEHMDVNPLGTAAYPFPAVEVRCVDGQVLPRTAVAHAVLIQAIAMSARRLEQDGHRVPTTPDQVLLDRNRSRVIAGGVAARVEVPAKSNGRDRRSKQAPVPVTDRLIDLVERMAPELAAMQVEVAELRTVAGGPAMLAAEPRAVCNENDLWRAQPVGDDLRRRLEDPRWLAADHISAANERLAPGAMAMASRFWAGRLTAQTAPPPRPTKKGAAEALFEELRGEPAEAAVLAALERYLAAGGPVRLHDELRKRPGEQAKQVRRSLRPPGSGRRTITRLPGDGLRGPVAAAARTARSDGRALISLRLGEADRTAAATAVTAAIEGPPPGVRLLLINDARFQDNGAVQITIEVLVVREGGAS
ncbi:hypothetical protein ACQP2X_34940 [Actinoplanes sp. CA-131856]